MPTEPIIVNRSEQPYVAIRGQVTMDTIGAVADRLPEVFGWLAGRGIAPVGAPFLRYHVIDMERRLDVEAGIAVATATDGEGDIKPGVLPAGPYATITHVGHPDQLIGITAELLDWASRRGLAWDMQETPDGQRWGCRLELFKTDPRVEPDPNKWETDLAFRLAD